MLTPQLRNVKNAQAKRKPGSVVQLATAYFTLLKFPNSFSSKYPCTGHQKTLT
jgi:hypothetical protein